MYSVNRETKFTHLTVAELLTHIIELPTDAEAYAFTLAQRPSVLGWMEDQLYIEYPGLESPRKTTRAQRIIREARA